jgi:PilZ domain
MTPSAVAPAVSAGTHVSVRLPHVGALPATVERAEAGALLLVLAIPDARVSRLGGAAVSVEATTGRGIQRFGGTLVLQPGRPDLLRVVLDGAAERIQRRDWARVEAVVPVRVHGIDEPVGGETCTRNVSGGGLLFVDPWHMPLGTDVRIELEVEPGAAPVHALGRVVREAGAELKGVRIDGIARDDEERLMRFVRARELAALRMGRR